MMDNYKNKRAKCVFLIYLSLFFMLYSDVNFGETAFFTNKVLSIYICALFIIINIDYFFDKFSVNKYEIIEILGLIFIVIYGYIKTNGGNSFQRCVNGYIGFVLIYLAFKIFFAKADKDLIDKMFKNMVLFMLIICMTMGMMQIIYIYFGHMKVLGNLLELLLYRGSVYFINTTGRVSLAYGEPSFCATFLYLYFIPAYIYCKTNKLFSKRFLNSSLIFVVAVHCLSLSVRFFIDTVAFLIILLLMKLQESKFKLNKKKAVISIIVSISLIFGFFYASDMIFSSNFVSRLQKVFNSFDFRSVDADGSTIVRLEYIYVAMQGFFHNPFLGIGMGNFYAALKDYVIIPLEYGAKMEIMVALESPEMTSYSFYTSAICEAGILGIFYIFIIIRNLFKQNHKLLRLVAFFILWQFIQNELFGFLMCAFWLSLINNYKLEN